MLIYQLQYQAHTEPVLAVNSQEQVTESRWHQPWSEPVRVKIDPRLARALAASGLISPILIPQFEPGGANEAPWHFPWSEPVRKKPGLIAPEHPFLVEDTSLIPIPAKLLEGWYNWYSEPVRFKNGLSAALQQSFAYHPRILPKPNITATMSAFEINTDSAIFAVYVIQSQPAASVRVSIVEIGSGNSLTSVGER